MQINSRNFPPLATRLTRLALRDVAQNTLACAGFAEFYQSTKRSLTRVKRRCYGEELSSSPLSGCKEMTLLQDLRYSLRSLHRNPGITAVAVISLSLGMGVNTSMFGIASNILRRNLSVRDSGSLVALHGIGKEGWPEETAYADFQDLRDKNEVFSSMAAYFVMTGLNIGGSGSEPQRIWGQLVTGNYFDMLGVPAAVGRTFLPEEDGAAGSHPVVVLSQGLWARRFHSDPAISGKTMILNGRSSMVVGVVRAGFQGLDPGLAPDLWIPLSMQGQVMPGQNWLNDRDARWLEVVGRLKPGISRTLAQASIGPLARRVTAVSANNDAWREVSVAPVGSMHQGVRTAVVSVLAILLVVVGLVLAIACANVANLLLSRAAERQKEIAIRLALGASRSRLVRQLLTESLVIAILGGVVGLLVSVWTTRLVTSFPWTVPVPIDFRMGLDARVLGFAAVLSLVTALVLRPRARSACVTAGPGAGSEGHSRRLPRSQSSECTQYPGPLPGCALSGPADYHRPVPPQFVACRLHRPGFTPRPSARGFSRSQPARVLRDAGEEFLIPIAGSIACLPRRGLGCISDTAPLGLLQPSADARPEESGAPGGLNANSVDTFVVAPHYFETLGISCVRGRDFSTEGDTAPRVAIVDEVLARRFWPNQDPLRQRLHMGSKSYEVIGIVRSAKSRLSADTVRPAVYRSLRQEYKHGTPFGMAILVRTLAEPARFVGALRTQVTDLDQHGDLQCRDHGRTCPKRPAETGCDPVHRLWDHGAGAGGDRAVRRHQLRREPQNS